MKKSTLTLIALLLAGCHTPPAPSPTPKPPLPHFKAKPAAALSPKAATVAEAKPMRLLTAGVPAPRIPSWTFTNAGSFQILASTNLTTWWTIAVVEQVTNITITSDTVNKRPMLFYRLTAIP